MRRRGPSKWAEAIVGLLLPRERREEILGDLHERYRSPWLYALDALRIVPLVILSELWRSLRSEMGSSRMSAKTRLVAAGIASTGVAVFLAVNAGRPEIIQKSAPFLCLLCVWIVLVSVRRRPAR
jgi:hypothetical protein